jgi:hypothetical protein
MTSGGAPDHRRGPGRRPAGRRAAPYIIRTVNMRAPKTVEKLINVHKRGRFHQECEANRMETPVFTELDPPHDCDCPGPLRWSGAPPEVM